MHFFTILIATALLTSTALAGKSSKQIPPRENISDRIIRLSGKSRFVTASQLQAVLRQETIRPSSNQAAGITRSRVGFQQISEAGSAFTIPPVRGAKYVAKLKGSVRFEAQLSQTIETNIRERATSSSSSLKEFYEREEKRFRASAKARYFCFFQAAAEYGYTNIEENREVLNSNDYKSFAEDTKDYFEGSESQLLEASYDTKYRGVSDGPPGGLVTAFAYVAVNQLDLQNGNTINVVQDKPELVIADEKNDVLDRQESGKVTITPVSLNDLTSDVSLD